jgi:GNAT superfamily N-acetyltransferase
LAAAKPASVAIELTFAQADDFEELVALRLEAMRESLERIGRWDPARSRERFRAVFSPEHTRHILVGGQRVGFVAVKPHGDGLLLDHLYVRPAAQGRGVGAAVLALVFGEADALSIPLRVVALRESASNRFYLRHGFQLVGHEEFDNHYIRHDSTRKGPQ